MEIRFSILLLLLFLLFVLHSSMCVFIIYTLLFLVTEAITAAAAKFKNLNDFPLDLSIITLDGVYKGSFINDVH